MTTVDPIVTPALGPWRQYAVVDGGELGGDGAVGVDALDPRPGLARMALALIGGHIQPRAQRRPDALDPERRVDDQAVAANVLAAALRAGEGVVAEMGDRRNAEHGGLECGVRVPADGLAAVVRFLPARLVEEQVAAALALQALGVAHALDELDLAGQRGRRLHELVRSL